jgi:hypothetical protein
LKRITNNQEEYDLVYKDILINSQLRGTTNGTTYTETTDKYTFSLSEKIYKIYKAELIDFEFIGTTTAYKKIFISLGEVLDGNSIVVLNKNLVKPSRRIFAQVPISSSFLTPSNFTSSQLYNPPVTKLSDLYINIYNVDFSAVSGFPEHTFTIRIYYFEKRNTNLTFSY